MTIVGHSIMGLALGTVFMPRVLSKWAARGFLVLMAAMACLPDWRVPFHRQLFNYNHHHSLLVNCIILAGIAGAMALAGMLKSRRGWLILVAISAAVLSHLLMDSFYSHAKGVQIAWPLGSYRLALPIPWLHVQTNPGSLDWFHIRIRLIEILTFGPLLGAAIIIRALLTKLASPEVERGGFSGNMGA